MAKSTQRQINLSKFKKPKKITYSKAKKDLWVIFSQYIRLRDCLKTTNTLVNSKCFTCERIYSFGKLQAGHWIPGRHNAILYDERGVNAQCYHCNVGLKGNPIIYYDKMLLIYGKEICEELKRKDKEEKQYKVYELLELKEQFEKKIILMKNIT